MALPNYRQAVVGGPGGMQGARKLYYVIQKIIFTIAFRRMKSSFFLHEKDQLFRSLGLFQKNEDIYIYATSYYIENIEFSQFPFTFILLPIFPLISFVETMTAGTPVSFNILKGKFVCMKCLVLLSNLTLKSSFELHIELQYFKFQVVLSSII